MTIPKDKKWLVYVNGLFMSGHATYAWARISAGRFEQGKVEIRTTVNDKKGAI